MKTILVAFILIAMVTECKSEDKICDEIAYEACLRQPVAPRIGSAQFFETEKLFSNQIYRLNLQYGSRSKTFARLFDLEEYVDFLSNDTEINNDFLDPYTNAISKIRATFSNEELSTYQKYATNRKNINKQIHDKCAELSQNNIRRHAMQHAASNKKNNQVEIEFLRKHKEEIQNTLLILSNSFELSPGQKPISDIRLNESGYFATQELEPLKPFLFFDRLVLMYGVDELGSWRLTSAVFSAPATSTDAAIKFKDIQRFFMEKTAFNIQKLNTMYTINGCFLACVAIDEPQKTIKLTLQFRDALLDNLDELKQ